ncbi:MAG TPA: hypothetical protein DG754_14840 [Bacteroidales bacterium]|nr:hypothetical protein [Bacteroidales bacterium]
MTPIESFEKQNLSEMDMSMIQGKGWSNWEQIHEDGETGVTMEQRRNWWGLNGTDETRTDNCNCD